MNIFTIFLSVALVAFFLWICYFNRGIVGKNNLPADGHNHSLRRNLNASSEHWDIDQLERHSSLQQDIENAQKDPQEYVKFLKQQRFTFFSKVEDDYLKDPENETLQIFKSDKNSESDQVNYSIQQKLIAENGTQIRRQPKSIEDYIDSKNDKYKNIESLFCETSTMFSEDLQFAYDDEINFLHIMLKIKGIEVVNSHL